MSKPCRRITPKNSCPKSADNTVVSVSFARVPSRADEASKVPAASHLIIIAAHTSIDDKTVDRYVNQQVKVTGVPAEEIQGYANHMKQSLASKSPQEKREWARQQCYIALGTLLAAAAALEIDSCPMTGIQNTEYDRVLGLADLGLETSSIMAIGH